VVHRYAAVAFAAAFATVAASAHDGAAAAWVGAYGLCVTAMLTVSALYHAARRSEAARRVLKRVDHAMILVAIAGSYTGIVGLSLEGRDRSTLLATVWAMALVGVAIRMLWLHAPYPLTAAVYVAVGWAALLDIDGLRRALTTTELALVVAGGVLYSVGAVVYALHRPNPWPATFGYHEVFHSLVVLAAATHLAAVLLLVHRRPG
jgi:hemolysin III